MPPHGQFVVEGSTLASDQIRSFISIDLDDEQILSKVMSVTSSLTSIGADMKMVERDNIHLTLKFLGSISSAKIAEVKAAMSQVRFEPFSLEIKGAGAFPSIKRMSVVWIGVGQGWSKAEQMFEQTETLLHRTGFPRETRPFNPHITIARVRSSRKIDELAAFLQHLSNESFGTLGVDKIRLKQSVLTASGPTYTTLYETFAQK